MAAKSDKNQKNLPEILTRGVAEILPSTESLHKRMKEGPLKLYLGIDPTGSLLTLGHSVVLRKLQQFAEDGHEVILLIGNGTVRIGDPTGKDSTRPELSDEQIEENFKTWKQQASKILDFNVIKIKHNGDWLDKLDYKDIIKLMANITVQQLLERDMFQDRMAKGLPIHGHEIMYPLMQGYDSVAMDVDLELGGTDQTFNMMMGRSLQKIYNDREKWVLTTPIINGTDGRKMSKSYNNFIALTEEPIGMFGKLMSVADDMIVDYFTLLTDVSMDEILDMKSAMKNGENPMTFKKKLAMTITTQYHSPRLAKQAQEHFEQTVQAGEVPKDLTQIVIERGSIGVIDLLAMCEKNESRSNLRRLVEQGGVELINSAKKLTDPTSTIAIEQPEIIRIGKRRFFKIVPKN